MTLTHIVTADLNGTGVMVDITSRVDMATGLSWDWGRSDWLASAPNPGTLTLSLDNYDGAFTPGSPSGLYAVGVAEGCAVYWWIGDPAAAVGSTAYKGRTLLFWMGPPEISFPNGGTGSSVVTVQCVDVIGRLALRSQLTMYEETQRAVATLPVLYWPCNEGAATGQAVEVYGGPSLLPKGAGVGWGNGGGVPSEAKADVYLQSGVVNAAGATEGGTSLSASGFTVPTRDDGSGVAWWTLTMWVTFPQAYQDAAAGGRLTLAEVIMAEGWSIVVMVIPKATGFTPTLTLYCSLAPGTGDIVLANITSETTHFVEVQIGLELATGIVWGQTIVDGGAFGLNVLSSMWQPSGNTPTIITVGSCSQVTRDAETALSRNAVDWVGAVGKVALYSGQVDNTGALYLFGATGGTDTPAVRLNRLLAYSGLNTTGLARNAPLFDQLIVQDTEGASMLETIAEALRGERARFTAGAIYGPPPANLAPGTVMAVYQGAANNTVPRLVIDAETQSDGVPPISHDLTGRVVTASAVTRSQTVTYTDPTLALSASLSASETAALTATDALLRLAQNRVAMGRTALIQATEISIDLLTSVPPAGGWLAAILPTLDGDRLRVVNLPATILGQGQTDQYVSGGTEVHTVNSSRVTYRLQPADAPVVGFLSPESSSQLAGVPDSYWRLAGGDIAVYNGQYASGGTLRLAVTATGTSLQVSIYAGAPLYSTDSADYPVYLSVGRECVQATQPPTNPTGSYQRFDNVVRGALTTNPRPHPVNEITDVWLIPTAAL